MPSIAPKHPEELERLIDLSELQADYSNLHKYLGSLTELSCQIAGSSIALINLIDNHTMWTISRKGLNISQLPREDSVCQYTILEKKDLEILDLSDDPRFKDRDYVVNEPKLSYYYGVPLFSENTLQLGTLCIFDENRKKALEPEKKKLLTMISKEIVNRLQSFKELMDLQDQIDQLIADKRKLSHDIRSPLNGIIGLTELIEMKEKGTKVEDILDLLALVKKGGRSIVELTDEILSSNNKAYPGSGQSNKLSCDKFCTKLDELYKPQALAKDIELLISTDPLSGDIEFPKAKLTQIAGNLISNSIKFTEPGGQVHVQISIKRNPSPHLILNVQDTGVGMTPEVKEQILAGVEETTTGTSGELGYGYGLSIVKYLIDEKEGTMHIESEPGKGSTFEVKIPL